MNDTHTSVLWGGVMPVNTYVAGTMMVALTTLLVRAWQRRLRGGGVGPGATGTFSEFHVPDKRAALEVIVERRAAYRDPEHRDGNLPELEEPCDLGRHQD